MGNSQTRQKINYDDVQYVMRNSEVYILINTLNEKEQDCLILNTLSIENEIDFINKFMKINNKQVKIIIYGRNCNDENVYTKYTQLNSLGFYNIYLYAGGLFEWLMLQDIYGDDEFPTTKKELDILKYKPNKILNVKMIEY